MVKPLANSRNSLHVRIALYFIGLFAAVQLITHFVVHNANMRIASAHTAEQLNRGERVLRRLLDERGASSGQAVRILVADFAFRKAVAAGDPATMQSALDNHGARLRSDIGFVVSDNKQIMARFGLPKSISSEAIEQVIQNIEQQEDLPWVALIGGRAILFAVAPILMPDANGWAAFGSVLDDRVATDLKNLTDLDISFLATGATGQYQISGSTLVPAERTQLQARLAGEGLTAGQWPEIELDGHAYATSGFSLESDTHLKNVRNASAAILVQKSVEQSTAPFKHLSVILSVVSFVGALAGMLCSVWIARAIAKPIRVLTEVTNRIRRGEKAVAVPRHFTGEIGELATGFVQMNLEIDKREEEILRLAFVDPLTQLANRAGLMQAVDRMAIQTPGIDSSWVAIVSLDIARLQQINDSLGFTVGDQVIKAVAARLKNFSRAGEVVARIEGDGFAWLVLDTKVAAIDLRLRVVLDDFASHPINVKNHNIDVQLHAGWAASRAVENNTDELFRRAEIALHVASTRRISPVRHEQSMDIDSSSQLGLLSALRRAVIQGDLILHYQPKLTINGKPVGVEALLRWNHPSKGLIGPSEFIEFAEQTGSIRAITRHAVQQAIRQSVIWEKIGLYIPIAVNISAHDLQDESFTDFVTDLLKSAVARPALLKFEITERALMDNLATAERALKQLGAAGIEVALDDYGTGYAALTHLSRLPVSEIKIDRSFVSGLTVDSRNFAITLTTVELAHRLKMRVVAEGVETVEELTALRKTGCDQVQGFLFGKPLPAEELRDWWQARLAAYVTIERARELG